jgi:ATP-dependent helicase/DNAse subunit B
VLAELAGRLPGRRERPISASSVEDYAACPFKFFARHVLVAREVEETDEELDAAAEGQLWHEALTELYGSLAQSGALPIGASMDLSPYIRDACRRTIERWRSERPIGNEALFAIEARHLEAKLRDVLRIEQEGGFSGGLVPRYFEHRFDALALASSDANRAPIWVHGSIDRVDVLGGRGMIIEYKRGSAEHYKRQGRPESNRVSAWQLPIYAAAARALFQLDTLFARYVVLRSMDLTEPLSDPDRGLGDELAALVDRMRGGDFAVRPAEKACDRCSLDGICRVQRTGELGPEGSEP